MKITRSTTVDSIFKTSEQEDKDYYIVICIEQKDSDKAFVRSFLRAFVPYLQMECEGYPTPDAFMQQFDYLISAHKKSVDDFIFTDDMAMAIEQANHRFDNFRIVDIAVEKVEEPTDAAKYRFTLKDIYSKEDVEHYKLFMWSMNKLI